MANPLNNGHLVGRLAADPVSFVNGNGSKKVRFSVYADRNFTDREGKRGSDKINLEAFVRESTEGIGPFGSIHKGDLVAIEYSLRQNDYKKGDEMVYDTVVFVESISFLENKAVTGARLAKRLQETQDANTAAAAAEPALAGSAVGADADLPFSG